MKDHQTFSLTTILNTQRIQPHVYQTLIHGIKSPLQQQSFDLTNDNSISIDRVPRRPNIPPPPPKSPLAHLDHNFSRTHESFSLSFKESPTKTKEIFQDEVIESVLSPLDYQITQKEDNSYVPFCGGIIDSILKSENEIEMSVPQRGRSYKRRPIFQNYNRQKVQAKPMRSIQSAIRALKDVNQPQLALFLELLAELEVELKAIDREREELKDNLDIIYQRLSSETQYAPETTIINDTHNRILRRLCSKNTGEVLAKVLRKKMGRDSKIADKKLQKLFVSLNRIEQIINAFLKKSDSVASLDVVYSFLMHNFNQQITTVDQLLKLFESLGISLQIDGLQFIWPACRDRVLKRQEFIEGISLNDLIVRTPKGFQEDLESKGFMRNY